MSIDIKKINDHLAYDSATGQFKYVVNGLNKKAGRAAGSISKVSGYVYVCVQGKRCYGHRMAWAMTHGEWPVSAIDHINGNKSDNRISNLRLATDLVNAQNIRVPQSNNTSGLLGVSYCSQTKRWRAQIGVSRKNIKLGRFDTPELAHQAYLMAKRRLHEGCTI
jgi:hypothetical protein